jgi:hypothetical protein
VRFGFGSTPRTPSLVRVVTLVVPGSRPSDMEAEGAGASQRASASEERIAPGSRPSVTEG